MKRDRGGSSRYTAIGSFTLFQSSGQLFSVPR